MARGVARDAHVRILERLCLAGDFVRLWRVRFALRRRDGAWRETVREVSEHGDAAAVLPVDPVRRTALLVRQFRLPAFLAGQDGMLVEACAGIIDEGEAPADCARREALEETGRAISALAPAGTLFSSPGTSGERFHLFLAEYGAEARRHDGGGLDHEDEDIELVELPLAELAARVESGAISDAKTALLVATLRLRRPELFAPG